MHFRASGLDVWENWERTKTQFCIPLRSSCLPLESSQRRQRHPIATPLKDTKGRNPTTEQFFCIFCVDFECQSEKGGDPASGPPPSLPAGEGLMMMMMMMMVLNANYGGYDGDDDDADNGVTNGGMMVLAVAS